MQSVKADLKHEGVHFFLDVLEGERPAIVGHVEQHVQEGQAHTAGLEHIVVTSLIVGNVVQHSLGLLRVKIAHPVLDHLEM